jgi:hypothetical protein
VDMWGRRIILMTGAAVVCKRGHHNERLAHLCIKMCAALSATGWWIYVDQDITPNAVVICVIVFNAAFGYRYGRTGLRWLLTYPQGPFQLGPNVVLSVFLIKYVNPLTGNTHSPWLYPPEVSRRTVSVKDPVIYGVNRSCPCTSGRKASLYLQRP